MSFWAKIWYVAHSSIEISPASLGDMIISWNPEMGKMLKWVYFLYTTVDGRNPHRQKEGWNPNKIIGCLPSINWWFGFCNHTVFDLFATSKLIKSSVVGIIILSVDELLESKTCDPLPAGIPSKIRIHSSVKCTYIYIYIVYLFMVMYN